uniref:Uncharacterized protein n=1 Tax=Aegilops tauschii subsp. strangulata TaxID=200361 RepID=A0A452YLF3_AEGTS
KGNCSPGVTHSQHHSLDLVCSHSYRTLLPPVARSRRLQPSAPMVAKVGVCLLLSPPLTLGEKKVKATHEIEVTYHVSCLISFKSRSNAYFVLKLLVITGYGESDLCLPEELF